MTVYAFASSLRWSHIGLSLFLSWHTNHSFERETHQPTDRPTDRPMRLSWLNAKFALQTNDLVANDGDIKPGLHTSFEASTLAQLQNHWVHDGEATLSFIIFYLVKKSSCIIKTTYSCNQIHSLFALLPAKLFLWIKSLNIITFKGCNLFLAFLNCLLIIQRNASSVTSNATLASAWN